MIKTVEYEIIDKNEFSNSYLLVDVRSPIEFQRETIPGAINIPIFTNEEREKIGTIYIKDSVDEAKKLGVKAVSKKLPDIYEKIISINKKYESIVFFCARGGMRSSSLVSLFMCLGVNGFKLKGGYKGYRAYINDNLPKVMEGIKFVVIHGNTGVGKTNILKTLREKGLDMLDLESCANHRGSLLGSIGLNKENSQKQFESLVYNTLKKRKSNIVFIEGESKRIGNIILPEFLYSAMENGIHINITADINFRIDNIICDYVKDNDLEIIDSLYKLKRYISSKNIDRYVEEIKKHNYKEVVEELMVKYYDPMYESSKYEYELILENKSVEDTCEKIIRWINF